MNTLNKTRMTKILPIVDNCLRGDRVSQKMLYNHLKTDMTKLCLIYFKDYDDAMDAFQQGFITLFRDLHQFDSSKGKFISWCRRVFVNCCLQKIRSRKNVVPLGDIQEPMTTEDVELSVLSEIDITKLVALINELPNGYKVVFNLYIMEGYTHREISELLEISESTSKSQLFKAKRILRKLIIKHYPEYGQRYAKKA